MQVKTTMRYDLQAVRMAFIKEQTNKQNTRNKFGKDVEKGNPHTLLVRM